MLIKAGQPEAAKAALEKALAVQHGAALDPAAALEVASACFANGESAHAKTIIQAIAEDHHENSTVLAAAHAVFEKAGLGEEGAAFLENTRKTMIRLNNDAVALARSGELDKAISMLTEAATRLTNNAQVAINAALALLMSIQRQGMNPQRLQQAHTFLRQARAVNPAHPRLAEVVQFYRKLAPAGAPTLD